jgi:hypothetical protein
VTLLQQLDACCPFWRKQYNNDALAAALELGLIDEDEGEPELEELDFHDEEANWRRVYESTEDEE